MKRRYERKEAGEAGVWHKIEIHTRWRFTQEQIGRVQVQQEDGHFGTPHLGVLDDGPGDGDPLFLASRQLDTALADLQLIST